MPGATGLRWRVVMDAAPRTGPENMALDHALAELVGPDEGVLRLYGWAPHTISFGRNEPALGLYDPEGAAREGLGFVRRPTGGRAVLHAHEVTYCVVAGIHAMGGARAAYLKVNEGLVEGLRKLGCPARVASSGAVLPPDAGPCFQAPAPGEVVVAGRKLVGSAQVRLGDALLQHGSVILRGDQGALARLSGGGADPFPPATLEGIVGPVEWAEAAAAVAAGVEVALEGGWEQGEINAAELARARELERDRYGTDAWTWRR